MFISAVCYIFRIIGVKLMSIETFFPVYAVIAFSIANTPHVNRHQFIVAFTNCSKEKLRKAVLNYDLQCAMSMLCGSKTLLVGPYFIEISVPDGPYFTGVQI